MKKSNDFDAIAFMYDYLAGLVFGSSIKNSQLHFISSIPENSQILFIGGGTGWLLPEILKINPTASITYVELSVNMINQARKIILPGQEKSVIFIHNDICHFLKGNEELMNGRFDLIITNFFLDVYNEENILPVMLPIKKALKVNGQWICTDFVKLEGNYLYFWQKFLVFIMYKFFRQVCNLEGNRLLDFDSLFSSINMELSDEACFFHNMIKSSIFRKS